MTEREYNRLKQARYLENPNVRARVLQQRRERYANDHEYRERYLAAQRVKRAAATRVLGSSNN